MFLSPGEILFIFPPTCFFFVDLTWIVYAIGASNIVLCLHNRLHVSCFYTSLSPLIPCLCHVICVYDCHMYEVYMWISYQLSMLLFIYSSPMKINYYYWLIKVFNLKMCLCVCVNIQTKEYVLLSNWKRCYFVYCTCCGTCSINIVHLWGYLIH